MGNKVLTLTIKKKWFEMIKSGEKKEDYRELKDYYYRRLGFTFGGCLDCEYYYVESDRNMWHYPRCKIYKNPKYNFGYDNCPDFKFKGVGMFKNKIPVKYKFVEFRNGYKKDSPRILVKLEEITIGYGKEEWGAKKNKLYFILKLGRIMNNGTKNYEI